MTISVVLNWAAVVFGFAAAGLWLASTFVRVRPDFDSGKYQIIEDEESKPYDVLETAKRQAVWNRYAAFTTAVAVACQATSMLFNDLL